MSSKSTIEWTDMTWNPVTGCLHNCRYCYAREIAETNPNLKEFYPAGFPPLFHHERLDAPAPGHAEQGLDRPPHSMEPGCFFRA